MYLFHRAHLGKDDSLDTGVQNLGCQTWVCPRHADQGADLAVMTCINELANLCHIEQPMLSINHKKVEAAWRSMQLRRVTVAPP